MDDDSQGDREGVLRWLFDIIFVQQTAHIIEIPGDHCWLRTASEGCRSDNRGWRHLAPFWWVNRD